MTVIIVRPALLRVPSAALVDGPGREIGCDCQESGVRLPLSVLQDSHQNCSIELNVDLHLSLVFLRLVQIR